MPPGITGRNERQFENVEGIEQLDSLEELRAADRHKVVGKQSVRFQSRPIARAAPNANVEFALTELDDVGRDSNLNRDAGMKLPKAPQSGNEPVGCESRERRDRENGLNRILKARA